MTCMMSKLYSIVIQTNLNDIEKFRFLQAILVNYQFGFYKILEQI